MNLFYSRSVLAIHTCTLELLCFAYSMRTFVKNHWKINDFRVILYKRSHQICKTRKLQRARVNRHHWFSHIRAASFPFNGNWANPLEVIKDWAKDRRYRSARDRLSYDSLYSKCHFYDCILCFRLHCRNHRALIMTCIISFRAVIGFSLFLQRGAGLAEGRSGGSGGGWCREYGRQQVHLLGGGIPGHQGRQ